MALHSYPKLRQKDWTFVSHYCLVTECGLVPKEGCWSSVDNSLQPTIILKKGLGCGPPEANAPRSEGISTLIFKDLSGQCTTSHKVGIFQFLYHSDPLASYKFISTGTRSVKILVHHFSCVYLQKRRIVAWNTLLTTVLTNAADLMSAMYIQHYPAILEATHPGWYLCWSRSLRSGVI